MTFQQIVITISMMVLATVITRFLPFFVFKPDKPTPEFIRYLGKTLASSIFGFLIIYCLKNVSIFSGNRALPELIAIGITAIIHIWKRNMFVSMVIGTTSYMLMLQFVFAA